MSEESNETMEDSHFQVASQPSTASSCFSGTLVVGLGLGSNFPGVSYGMIKPQDMTVPRHLYERKYYGQQRYELLEWFNTSMLHDDDLPDDIRGLVTFIKHTDNHWASGILAVEATSNYLKFLWSDFRRRFPYSVFELKYDLVVTVPAVWPPYARRMMIEAVQAAKILSTEVRLTPRFLTDMEAVSIALLSDLVTPRGRVPSPKNGDVCIVCHYGDFTVESVVYDVISIQPLSVGEYTLGDHILTGKALIDDAFINLLKAKAKNLCPASRFGPLSEKDFKDFARACWEDDLKIRFSGDSKDWAFDLPTSWTGRGFESSISFSGFELALVFDTVVDKVINLIRSQIEKVTLKGGVGPSHLIMFGGLDRSPYFQTRIRQAVHEISPSTVVQYTPDEQG
ncbi:mitochondrial-type heat shock 70 [Fusarium longipes]|uniref:Mitochondrial-type heat shock 70 n=1 Tax=Fusarium longipes TaxID=694270 RepID=A0A395TAL2_9HYPO|nr:mitochondrial-type heat shock 70 [Fusarium longipes]